MAAVFVHTGEGSLPAPVAPMAIGLTAAELRAVAALWSAQKREWVARFGGTSMLPAIAPGQALWVRCGTRPRIGDVAVFQRGDVLTVHRVVAEHEGFLLTWGDGNIIPDDPVESSKQVLGVVVALDRGGAREPVPPAADRRWRRMLLRFLLPEHERAQGRFGRRVVRLRLLTGIRWGSLGPLMRRVRARAAQ